MATDYSNMSDNELLSLKNKLENEQSFFNNLQMAMKIL